MSRLLTPKDVFERLGVSRGTFYNLLKRDPTFPSPIYITPKTPRWQESEIDAWLDAQKPDPAAPEAA